MLARLSAFVIWALVAAIAVFWGLRLLVRAPAAPSYAVAVGDASAVRGDLTRLLGAAPVNLPAAMASPEASSRFRLFGIVAPKALGNMPSAAPGVALIAVDGKMPKAFTVGAQVDADLVLQSVTLRTVSIASASGAPAITLELPALSAAATGTLPMSAGVPPPPMPNPRFVPPPLFPQEIPTPVAAPQRPDGVAPAQ